MRSSTIIYTRITPLERKALEAISAREERGFCESIRQLIRDEAKRQGLWPGEAIKEPECDQLAQQAVS